MAFPSSANGFGQVDLSNEELATISGDTVFCHCDLEPPNILVRRSTSPDRGRSYRVAAIIDMSGIFPRGCEYAIKDTPRSGKSILHLVLAFQATSGA
jgi:hypothetical protein